MTTEIISKGITVKSGSLTFDPDQHLVTDNSDQEILVDLKHLSWIQVVDLGFAILAADDHRKETP